MQLVQPRPGGTVAAARINLVAAQGFAADVSNAPRVNTKANLTDGIRHARQAAAELFMAEPRSEFQDLIQARRHVIEGQQTLERALSFLESRYEVDHTPQIKQFAHEAFNAFEAAFEIIDND